MHKFLIHQRGDSSDGGMACGRDKVAQAAWRHAGIGNRLGWTVPAAARFECSVADGYDVEPSHYLSVSSRGVQLRCG
jgi:N-acyl-L-homoserine lactone synthetase